MNRFKGGTNKPRTRCMCSACIRLYRITQYRYKKCKLFLKDYER